MFRPLHLLAAGACVVCAALITGCERELSPEIAIDVKPKRLLSDGSKAVVTVFASIDTKGTPAGGEVRLRSSIGSLRDGVTLGLGEDGTAVTDFTCNETEDPECGKKLTADGGVLDNTVTFTAKWVYREKEYEGTATLAVTADPLKNFCQEATRKQVTYQRLTMPGDIRFALAPSVSEVTRIALPSGEEVGYTFFDPGNVLGGFVIKYDDTTLGGLETEAALRAKLAKNGAVNNPLQQVFTTWDGNADSVRFSFSTGGSDDIKTRINAWLTTLLGAGWSGMQGSSAAVGPYRVLGTLNKRLANYYLILAITPEDKVTPTQLARLDDLAGGSALAQEGDMVEQNCDTLPPFVPNKIDFLWVVDDSCSMSSSQEAVGKAGDLFVQRLSGSGVDWRVAAVSTGWYPQAFGGSYRNWTTATTEVINWFKASSPGSNSELRFGTSGSGIEKGFSSFFTFVDGVVPAGESSPGAFRQGVEVHTVFLSDTEDQSNIEPTAFLADVKTKLGNRRTVFHGIVCPLGKDCGDGTEESNGYYAEVIRRTGGILGNIEVFNPDPPTAEQDKQQKATINAIISSAVGGLGLQLSKRAIPASIRVAVEKTRGTCANNTDVPHDPENGWDFDSNSGRLTVYGRCGPEAGSTLLVLYDSYKDVTPPVQPLPPDAGRPESAPCRVAPDGGVPSDDVFTVKGSTAYGALDYTIWGDSSSAITVGYNFSFDFVNISALGTTPPDGGVPRLQFDFDSRDGGLALGAAQVSNNDGADSTGPKFMNLALKPSARAPLTCPAGSGTGSVTLDQWNFRSDGGFLFEGSYSFQCADAGLAVNGCFHFQ